MVTIHPGTPLRVIPVKTYSAGFNMAADEYLFKMYRPVLRFYAWEPATISFGKYIKKKEEIDFDYCKNRQYALVNRITGGKTVFHDRELTYSFVAPSGMMPAGILDTYRFISTCLIAGLKTFGVTCQMEEQKKTDATSVCFREISGYEVISNGKKLIGSAQHRNASGVLQHGSVLMDIRPEEWIRIWKNRLSPEDISRRVTSLKEITQKPVDVKMLSDCIAQGFESAGFSLKEEAFQPAELEKIHALMPKYLPHDSSLPK